MEEFASILQRDYGLKPQGKTAPIAATKGNGSGSGGENGNWREGGMARAGRNGSSRGSVLDQNSDDFGDDLFGLGDNGNVKPPGGRSDATLDPFGLSSSSGYDDVFGGPPKYSSPKFAPMSNHDDIFRVGTKPQPAMSKNANLPVFDTPVYDDDIFGGVPGVRSSAGVFDDVFNGGSAAPSVSLFDDLLGGYSAGERKVSRTPSGRSGLRVPTPAPSSAPAERDSIFDDLLSGVGSVESSKPRWSAEGKPPQQPESRAPADKEVLVEDAPGFVDPIISIMKQAPYPWMNDSQDGFPEDVADSTPSDSGAGLDGSFEYCQPTYESYFPRSSRPAKEGRRKDVSSSIFDSNINDVFQVPVSSPYSDPPAMFVEPDRVEAAYFPKVSRTAKDTKQNDSGRSAPNMTTEDYGFPLFEPNVDVSSVQLETETGQAGEEQWLTVDEVQLATAPSTTPPPYRQAPSWPNKRHVFPPQTYFQQEQSVPDYKSESSSQDTAEDLPFYQQPRSPPLASTVENEVMAAAAAKGIGGLEEFMASVLHKSGASSWPQEEASGANDGTGYQGEMKDNLNRGEVKLRQAKEAREKVREDKKREARGVAREKEGKEAREQILREAREKQERDREKQEKEKQIKEEKERERQKKERLKEREREREKDRAAERAAVERATSEARERAAVEARERAERAAVEKAAAEARERAAVEAKERAERAAVERAAAEARERAAAEAKERAERTAAAIEARQKVERAAVERATAEARERAAAEARARATADARARAERAATESVAAEVRERAAERAAAEARERAERAASERAERAAAERAREQQRRNDNDLDKLFNMGTRANSEPRQRPQNFDFTTDQRTSQAFGSEGQMRPPSSAPGVRKVPSTTNIDDWTSLFAPSAAQDEFQEIEGETPDRRRARLERHQRTMERAAKALADKNQRDLENQFEQAEKQRAGEVLDTEIKRWAAGKEGNLRALLSTLQYVLWPECGWQPVSLTDIINAIAVKKAYRKATLCVHPDKVQQKGATVQQKYIAEKVFDLLKEAWNKFNSEELF